MARRAIAATLMCLGLPLQGMAENGTGALLDSYTASGVEIFQTVAGENGNAVLSPLGIGTAMSMATLAASGDTAAEMADVLGLPHDPGILAEEAGALGHGEGAELTLANALHLTAEGDLVAESYRELLADAFAAGIFEGSDLETINAWVAERTQGRIDKLLDQLDPNSVAVILNAVHFKAKWAQTFKQSSTGPAPFGLASGESVDVETMYQTGSFQVLRGDEMLAIALPYDGDGFEMVITMPVDPATPVQPLAPGALAEVLAGLSAGEPEPVALSLPKVEMAFEADLIPGFKAMGLALPFDPRRAEFGGLTGADTGEDRVYITQIRHKAFLAIDEEGTEAAAATEVEMGLTSAAPPAEEFRIDRPFAFAIVDRFAGAVLFLGRVSDPR